MRVPEGDVSNRNAARMRGAELIFGNSDAFVRQRRAADGTEVIELYDEPLLYSIEIGDLREGAVFAVLRALAVSRVQ